MPTNWRFWVALIMTLAGLSGVGFAIAWLLVPPPADYFRARYFEFALPQGWHCERAGTETVCSPPGNPPQDAIIILAAKVRGGHDSRSQYFDYLGKDKTFTLPGGKQITSEVIYYRKTTIGGYQWVDALHRNSEVPGFNTRYLGTVTSHLGVVVTFTARHEKFEAYNRGFETSIATLRIYQAPSVFN
uniref:Uncharacterized protein n=1 Tax=Candidatus Kentrum sp. FW TaxID=2126338 RepID=A0A450T616_9GAMM|nr:MAG: hypothetical protein BECKFW1821B_GA0114236_10716 [Candidatus Kentron sp. FW]